MKGEDGKKPGPAPAGAQPVDPAHGSGEGAKTALEALIRKRKMEGTPDGHEPPLPGHPPQPAT